jgi:hypothetical protein
MAFEFERVSCNPASESKRYVAVHEPWVKASFTTAASV